MPAYRRFTSFSAKHTSRTRLCHIGLRTPRRRRRPRSTFRAGIGRKVVICFVNGEPIQAVLPAPLVVNLDRLLELAGGDTIRLARPEELRQLFPDC